MAYQARRTSVYTKDFELVDESGRVCHSMKVALDPGSIVEKLSRQYTELLKARNEVEEIKGESSYGELKDAYEKLGGAAITMIKSVFGEQDTKTILEFYRNRYNDIITEVMPFIINIVLPELREIAQNNRKEILQKYNRKKRRKLGKMIGKLWDI